MFALTVEKAHDHNIEPQSDTPHDENENGVIDI